MSRALKVIVYPLLFLLSFAVFLYWMFPYDVLKERVTNAIETQLGQGFEVDIQSFAPYWFTGIDVRGLTITPSGGDKASALLACRRMHARASFFSLLTGSPSIAFGLEIGKGEVTGTVRQSEEMLAIDAELSDVDLAAVRFVSLRTGLNLSSQIDGDVSLRIDRLRSLRSSGTVALTLRELKLAPSELRIGEAAVALPDLVIAKGRESQITLDIGKGTIAFENFRFTGGDLGLDIKGKLFLSSKVENYRFNVSGAFAVSKKLTDALPFLFIVEQQKQEDGSYPLTITGRLDKPSIKIGTFTVPL